MLKLVRADTYKYNQETNLKFDENPLKDLGPDVLDIDAVWFDDELRDFVQSKIKGSGASLPADTIQKYARFSEIAYLPNKKVMDKVREYNLQYNFDTGLSDADKKVFYTPTELVIAYRGTDTVKDVINDISIAFGIDKLINPRKSRELKHFEKTVKKYPGRKVVITGHSLGGKSVINMASKAKNRKVISKGYMYNGASKGDNVQFLGMVTDKTAGNYYNIRTKLDPVSLLNPFQEVEVKQKKGEPHTITNFT